MARKQIGKRRRKRTDNPTLEEYVANHPYPSCKQPDHDVPSLICGAPLPCPYHTAVIDMSVDPPELRVKLHGKPAFTAERLARITQALIETEDPDGHRDRAAEAVHVPRTEA